MLDQMFFMGLLLWLELNSSDNYRVWLTSVPAGRAGMVTDR